MIGSGRPRRQRDAYYTIDPLAVDTLARVWRLHDLVVWEPAAGRGHLVRDLRRYGAIVCASDIEEPEEPVAEGVMAPLDFFQATMPPNVEAIITNPPYREATAFIRHALELDPPLVCMLLRHEWICRKGETFENRLVRWIPIRGRLRWVENGPLRPQPRHNFAWGIWKGNGVPPGGEGPR